MGTVFKARQIDLGRLVALKIVNPTMVGDSDTLGRFEREAQILSELSHPHIGRFFRFGISPEKFPYIEMEFIEGESLRQMLNKDDCLEWTRATSIIAQACQAMEYAHSRGILHRDLKPSNIVVCKDAGREIVKVIDFGLAKLIARDERELQKLTQTGTLLGSVQYMSPELCSGRTLDHRADIYSLGCVLFECLTGRLPHEADNSIGLMHKHVNEDAQKPSILLKNAQQSQFPEALDDVVLKALDRNLETRYQSMEEFRNDLLQVVSGSDAMKIGRPYKEIQTSRGRTKSGFDWKVTMIIPVILILGLIYYFAFVSSGILAFYRIVLPTLPERDQKNLTSMTLERIEKNGNASDLEQLRTLIFLGSRTDFERIQMAVQFAKYSIQRKEIKVGASWANKALKNLMNKTTSLSKDHFHIATNDICNVFLKLPQSYYRGMEGRLDNFEDRVKSVDPESLHGPLLALRIRVALFEGDQDSITSKLLDFANVQMNEGNPEKALATISRAETSRAKGIQSLIEIRMRLMQSIALSKLGKSALSKERLRQAKELLDSQESKDMHAAELFGDDYVKTDGHHFNRVVGNDYVKTCITIGDWNEVFTYLKHMMSRASANGKIEIVNNMIVQLNSGNNDSKLDPWIVSSLKQLSKTDGRSNEYIAILIRFAQRKTNVPSPEFSNFILNELVRVEPITTSPDLREQVLSLLAKFETNLQNPRDSDS